MKKSIQNRVRKIYFAVIRNRPKKRVFFGFPVLFGNFFEIFEKLDKPLTYFLQRFTLTKSIFYKKNLCLEVLTKHG